MSDTPAATDAPAMGARAALGRQLRRLRQSQVRVRVGISATLVALVVATCGSVVFILSLRSSLVESVVASAEQQAAAVVAQVNDGTSPSRAVVGTIDDVTTQIIGTDGSIVASDRSRPIRPLRTTPGVSRGVRVKGLHDVYIVVAKRTQDGSLVVVGKSEEEVGSATATAIGLLLVGVPIAVALLAAVIWISVGRALRPVEVMRQEAASITSDHLHRRLPVPGGSDEISMLAHTLNEMLDRIDSSQRLQRQFISDASHELRSPLASMRQSLAVAHRFPDEASVGELVREMQAEEQRMEGLVTALLTLARMDDSSAAVPRDAVDLDDVVLEESTRAQSSRPGVLVVPEPIAEARAEGNPVLMSQLVRNLLSNAVRHARSLVRVSLQVEQDRVVLHVDDDGAGIAEDKREIVFERFVRLDEARARDSGGSGLGLAIARKVVIDAGGSIHVAASPLGGARLTVTLPRA